MRTIRFLFDIWSQDGKDLQKFIELNILEYQKCEITKSSENKLLFSWEVDV